MIELPKLDYAKVSEQLEGFIRRFVERAEAKGVVVGLSSGVDSAVATCLCVRSLGAKKVLGLILPERGVTPLSDVEDAKLLATGLGIEHKLIDISELVAETIRTLGPLGKEKVAEGNVRARLRMLALYYAANISKKLVVGSSDKSEILIGYFCYDSATRALTTEGLKAYHELRPGDVVFSLNLRTGAVEEVPVKAVYAFDYDGPMIRFSGKRTDLLVTLNHRMLVVQRAGNLDFVPAVELASERRLNLPMPKPWRGEETSSYINISQLFDQSQLYHSANRIPNKLLVELFLYLMGLHIGDGTCSTHAVKTIRGTVLDCGNFTVLPEEYRCEEPITYFSIPKGDKARDKLEDALRTLGIPYRGYADFVKVSSRPLYEVLKLCGTHAKDKRIPRWVLSYPADKLMWLFKGLIDSDGWSGQCYQTISCELALNIVELCAKLGMHATILAEKPKVVKHRGKIIRSERSYVVSIARGVRSTVLYQWNVATVHYRGIVWCPDVPPHHNLLVERNGKFTFCGNTKYGDGGADLLPLGDLYKTQVRELARFLGLPKHIAEKPSSPRLWRDQTAEEELGLSYNTIDLILHGLFDLKLSEQRVATELGIERNAVRKVSEMVKRSSHKREVPPIARLRI